MSKGAKRDGSDSGEGPKASRSVDWELAGERLLLTQKKQTGKLQKMFCTLGLLIRIFES